MATLDGQARPVPIAVSFFCGAFIVSPTLGAVLTFVVGCCGGVQLYGLWFGLIGGYTVTTLFSLVATIRSDWPQLATLAMKRSECLPDANGCSTSEPPLAPLTPAATDGEADQPAEAGGVRNESRPLIE
eukprot:7314060-Prymnesium_polylepis.2